MSFFTDPHYFLILALVVLTLGLSFLVYKWPKGPQKTFSQHAATNKSSVLYYIGLFTAVLPLLAVFFFGWFVNAFDTPFAFSILLIISLVCQYACTFIPEVGKKALAHQILAGISAVVLIPALVLVARSTAIQPTDVTALIIGITVMGGVLLLATTGRVKHALILQAVYFIAFFTPLLIISYT
ncbi:MAG: hypothetical protein WAQ27_04725 [Candidatus Microsaccharimonas sp.]